MKDIIRDSSMTAVGHSRTTLLVGLSEQEGKADSFAEVVSFVDRHSPLLVLSDEDSNAAIAVWPAMQGRVLTSTANGPQGHGFGWLNRELIASGGIRQHVNAVGGEDRIWIGPEGGQFSIFFEPGVPFDLDHWFTPPPIDTGSFDIVRETKSAVTFRKAFPLTNYSGTKFKVQVDREVRILSRENVWNGLGISVVPGVEVVGFESENRLTNISPTGWSRDSGLLSLWVIGQFNSTPKTTVVLPVRVGAPEELGVSVTTDYFGAVPEDRIFVNSDKVLFRADSNYRSKLGLSQQRARGIIGSYDELNSVLTIVQYSQPSESAEYVNSAWEIQAEPYRGDVANCYNDGPPSPGVPQLGHFYELESSSPAKPLKSLESVEHTHRTVHLVGSELQLDSISSAMLGVRLKDVLTFNP